jgi:hypothetical protein
MAVTALAAATALTTDRWSLAVLAVRLGSLVVVPGIMGLGARRVSTGGLPRWAFLGGVVPTALLAASLALLPAFVDGPVDPVVLGRWAHEAFNVLEAIVWLAAAVVLALRASRASAESRRRAAAASVFFLLFSASDVWEVFTETWFRPLPLLILKIASGGGLLACLWLHVRRKSA